MPSRPPANLLSTSLPRTSRVVRLRARPTGLPRATDFVVTTEPAPLPGEGELLIRNRFFRVSASVRMMISEGAAAVEGVPFPALGPGDALSEEAVGEVVFAPAGSPVLAGALVRHRLGFRELAAVGVDQCEPLGDELPDPAAHLGHGSTAYAALTRAARVRAGETVFVSSAAGAVGSLAAFIARRLGAGRIIGGAGSREKAAWLIATLGYDAAVVRGAAPLPAQLRAAAPDGVDLVLDLAGGEQLAAAIEVARRDARVIILGALSGQLAAAGTGRTAPVTLDSFPIILQRLSLRGYSADDDPDARREWNALYGAALRAGEMPFPHTRIDGLERVPDALEAAACGRTIGAVIAAL